MNILYLTLQVALPLNDEYKPLKARVGKAAKVWHWTCTNVVELLLDYLVWFHSCNFACRNILSFLTHSSVKLSCASTTMSLCWYLRTHLLARLSVLSKWRASRTVTFSSKFKMPQRPTHVYWCLQFFLDMLSHWPSERSKGWYLPAPSRLFPTRNTGRCMRSSRMWDWWLVMSPSTLQPPASSWQQRWGGVLNGYRVGVIWREDGMSLQAVFLPDPEEHAVPRFWDYEGSSVGRLWWNPLHERCRFVQNLHCHQHMENFLS